MINLLFCGNEYVFDGILTCMLSIFKRSKYQGPYNIYIYTMDVSYLKENYKPISDGLISFLDDVVKQYHPENKITKVDVTDIYLREFKGCPNEGAYCSPYTLIRLFADLVDGMPDKFLYLDVDIMFNRDIELLYNQDIKDYEFACARDHYGKYLIQPNYMNAGVILFNLAKAKETKLFEKCREILKKKKLIFADQSALMRSVTRKKMLPQKFNDQKFLHKHTVVRHFSKRLFWLPYPHTDNIKQWKVSKVHKVFGYYCFDDIYEEYIYLKNKYNKEIKK